MEVAYLMLAPYAELHQDGKIYVLSGDIDNFRVPATLPAAIGLPIYVLGKIRFEREESGREYTIRVEILAPDGAVLETTDRPVTPPVPEVVGRQSNSGFLLLLTGLTFPTEGEYAVRLSVDGAEQRRLRFHVEQIPPQT